MAVQQQSSSNAPAAGTSGINRRRSSLTSVARECLGASFDPKNSSFYTGVWRVGIEENKTFGIENPTPLNRKMNSIDCRSAPHRKPSSVRSFIPTPTTGRRPLLKSMSSTKLEVTTRNKPNSFLNRGSAKSTSRSVSVSSKSATKSRRSTSVDSFCWSNSIYTTPSNTRRFSGQTFSTCSKPLYCPRSAENVGRTVGFETVQKVLKAPHSTDKNILNQLALLVNDFLTENEYQKVMTVAQLNRISVAEYFNICQFVLRFIHFSQFLTPVKHEDMSTLLVEAATSLEYPGSLSKSILKTVNTPHTWPAALTFLGWLTCRVKIVLSVRVFGGKRHSIAALGDNAELCFSNFTTDSYRRMFKKCIRGADQNTEGEKEEYRKNIMEAYLMDQNETVDSLSARLLELQQKLVIKETEVDPTLELLANTKVIEEKVAIIKAKSTDAESNILKHKNVEHITTQTASLSKKLVKEQELLDELVQRVKLQPLDLDGKKALLHDIEQIKKQKSTVEQMVEKDQNKLNVREQARSNCRDLFYQVCEKLRMVDDFNEQLGTLENRNLVVNMERIQRNPFTPVELDSWLQEVRSVIRYTDQILVELNHNFEEWHQAINLQMKTVQEEIEICKKDSLQIQNDIESLRQEDMEGKVAFKDEENEIEQKQLYLASEERKLYDISVEIQKELEVFLQNLSMAEEMVAALQQETDASDLEVEETYLKMRARSINSEVALCEMTMATLEKFL